jgi:putative tricarboxylic transport membrane protein
VSSAASRGTWLEPALGISLAAVGGYFAYASSRLPAGPDPSAPGPGVAPGFLGLALVACGLLLAIRALLAEAAARKASAAVTAEKEAASPAESLVKPAIAIGLLTASAVLLEPLGFMLSTSLFLFAGFVWLGSADWRAAVSAAALTSVSLWLFFTKLLGVGLPFGRLVEILFY